MIGSYAGFSFMAFLQNPAIICAINTLALFVMSKFYYGKLYANAKVEDVQWQPFVWFYGSRQS